MLGLQPGDTVAIVIPNGVEMIATSLATASIGLYLTPINHHLVGPEIAYIVRDSDARAFFVHERFGETGARAAEEAGVMIEHVLPMPDMAVNFAQIVYAAPIQMLAYHTAVIMGKDADQPRNLAKSVTVE